MRNLRRLFLGLGAVVILAACQRGEDVDLCYQTSSGEDIACTARPTSTGLSTQSQALDIFVCANGTTEATDAGQGSCAPGKVEICHFPPGNRANAHTLCVGPPAVPPHLRLHGDHLGACVPGDLGDAGTPPSPACTPPTPGADSDHDGVPDEIDCDFICPGAGGGAGDGGSGDGTVDAGSVDGCTGPGDGSTDGGMGTGGNGLGSADGGTGIGITDATDAGTGIGLTDATDAGTGTGGTGNGALDGGLGIGVTINGPPDGGSGNGGAITGTSGDGGTVGGNGDTTVGPTDSGDGGTPSGKGPRRLGYSGWGMGCSTASGAALWPLLMALPLLLTARRRRLTTKRALPVAGWPMLSLLMLVSPVKAQSAPEKGSDLPVVSTTTHELPPVPSADAYGRLHVLGATFIEAVSRQAGFEVGATGATGRNLDVGAAVVLGKNLGYRALVAWHPTRPGGPPLLPFVQLRAIVHPVPQGVGLGGGAWGGMSYEVGPGRVQAGPLLEAYYGPKGYYPFAAFFMASYEVDLFKPQRVLEYRDRLTEVVREKRIPERSLDTRFKVRVTDLDNKAVVAKVRIIPSAKPIPNIDLTAKPEAETAITPGAYHAEVSADGYLVAGGEFSISEGETRVEHFLLRPIPRVPAARLTPKRIEVSQRIDFEFDRAVLLPSSFPILDEVVDILMRSPTLQVRVEGHTCSIGTAEYNQSLSEQRAAAVMTYLVHKGVPAERLTSAGYGLTRPLFDNRTEEGRRKNRRVQFEIVHDDKAPAPSDPKAEPVSAEEPTAPSDGYLPSVAAAEANDVVGFSPF